MLRPFDHRGIPTLFAGTKADADAKAHANSGDNAGGGATGGGSPGGSGPVTAQAGAGTGDSGVNSATTTNATMTSRQVRKFCRLDAAGETILKQAMTELGLSARAHDKVLRIARTIADLEGAAEITANHLAEAICTRGIMAEAFWQRAQNAA